MTIETVAVAADHGGYSLKETVLDEIRASGREVIDLGTADEAPVDYPDFAARLTQALGSGDATRGVLICGTGIGVSIAANRDPAIRAALCYDEETAILARKHNNANVLCLGGRKTENEEARKIVRLFLASEFEGGRHQKRIAKLDRTFCTTHQMKGDL